LPAGNDPLGITLADPAIDMNKTIAWKDGIVGRLTTALPACSKRRG
jgi:dihydrolipoamide dehydrogenase